MSFFQEYISEMALKTASVNEGQLQSAVDMLSDLGSQRKVIIVGNGGSAAIAAHVAVDLTKAAGIPSVTFNEADLITCFANDYGYENWVSKALENYAHKGDCVILISSSGRSPNIINAARVGRKMGLSVITFSGFDIKNELNSLGDLNFWVDSCKYNVVEMVHHIWLVAIVDKIVDEKTNS